MAKDFKQEREAGGGGETARPAPAQETYWQHFPRFEKLLEVERPDLLAKMESTCRQLDGIMKTGSPQEQSRAQAAMTAYLRTLELYRQLAERRDKTYAEVSNPKAHPRDK